MSKPKIETEIGEYKGNKTIAIHTLDDKGKRKPGYPLNFGVAKAKLIIEAYEEIKKFVEENDK